MKFHSITMKSPNIFAGFHFNHHVPGFPGSRQDAPQRGPVLLHGLPGQRMEKRAAERAERERRKGQMLKEDRRSLNGRRKKSVTWDSTPW